jgi:ABC-type branched-subunit amino acid transport system substrate-binding protein
VPLVRRTSLALVVALGLAIASFATVTSAGASAPAANTASEIGVTAKTVNIAVIADVDNSLAPNAFKPIVDGAQAGVKYVNANGGIGGRTLKMDFIDSHLNPNDTRNAIIKACSQDLSMVSTATALFTGLSDLTGCTDKAGQATGLPDIGSVVLGTQQACAPTSFPVIPSMIDCSTVGKNPQTYRTNQGVFKYLSKQHKGDLKGPFIKSSDSPDAARSTDSLADAAKNAGIDVTSMPSLSNSSPQSAFTPVVTQMKQDGDNWSDNGLTTPGAVLLRQEAELQGLDSSKIVWQCTSACYDEKQIAAAGDAMEGEYVDLGFLPFAEAKSNKTLADYLKYIGKDNASAFGVYGFEAVLAFQQAANTANKASGGLTRTSLLDALKNLHSFNAGGMTGTVDIGGKVPSSCFLVVQWKGGTFNRVYPKKAGTFDCTTSNRYTYQTDLTTP